MHSLGRRASSRTGPVRWAWPLILLLGALSLLPAAAYAKTPKSAAFGKDKHAGATEPREKVKQLAQEGVTALAAKDFATALRTLSAAYRLAPSPPLLYQLGQLALAESRMVEAQDFFRRYLHDTTDGEDSPAHKEAQRVLGLPAPPSGEISIVGDRNVVVLIDDHIVGVVPLPLAAAPAGR